VTGLYTAFVVMVRVAAGGQLGPPPDRHQPDPPVQRPQARAAIRPVSWPPPSAGRLDRSRSASPAVPSSLNRQIHRRTIAGWELSGTAICAEAYPCSDNSTITARVACRHRPCSSASKCLISLPRPLENTLTGHIRIATSPASR